MGPFSGGIARQREYGTMDFLIGITGKDFVLMASDCSQARSIVVMKRDMDKSIELTPNTLMLTSGPLGDTVSFGEYIAKNLKLNSLRNDTESSPWSNANYVRHQLAEALRSRNAYQVNLLIGGHGVDKEGNEKPQLYFMDYLAAFASVPFAAQGYGSYFTLSIMDKHFKEDMTLEEAKSLLERCIEEVRKRFMVQMPKFFVRVVDKDGIRRLDDM
mmetsp:Transcript_14904/g.38180  ORF Transcript_14904/g.38180 Transcript_14904/m.38180 type:complete len:215 (-) Transcript_14904:276-920(-)